MEAEAHKSTVNCDQYATYDRLNSDPSANFAAIFKQRPMACYIVFGEANSDLAGIGALVSYTTLALLNVVFSIPLLLSYFVLLRTEGKRSLRRLFKRFFIAETLLVIPILVACVVLSSREISFFESFVVSALCFYALAGLGCLVLMEFQFLVSTFLRSRQQQNGTNLGQSTTAQPQSDTKRFSRSRLCAFLSRTIISSKAFFRFHSQSEDSDASQSKIYLPALGVGTALSLVTIVQWTISSEKPFTNAWTAQCQGNYLGGWPVTFIVLGPVTLALLAVFIGWCARSRILRYALFVLLLAVLYTLLFLQIIHLVNIVVAVAVEVSFPGQHATIFEWGFGQVLSVFVWVPSLGDLCFWVLKAIRDRQVYWKGWNETKVGFRTGGHGPSPTPSPTNLALDDISRIESGQNSAPGEAEIGNMEGISVCGRPMRRTNTV